MDAASRLRSEVLDLDLHVRDGQLRFLDPATGEDLTTYVEAEGGRVAEKQRADAAEQERLAEKRRADAEKDRADAAERERAEEERKAEAAEDRAKAAERELARLRLRLDEP